MNDVIRRTHFNPAKLHGHIKIELFDAETKQLVQKIEKDNLVTNALSYMLNNVAGGTPSNISNLLMPVATRALGGLMLFSEPLIEDADNVHFPFAPNSNNVCSYLVAGAGRNTNTGNTMAGSLNEAESGPTNRGYVSVWDFGTSQANGVIKAAALTLNSEYAGTTPFRSGVNSYGCHYIRRSDGNTSWGAQPLYYDEQDQILYFTSTDSSMGYSKTSVYDPVSRVTTYTYTMAIYRTYLPLQKYQVGDPIDKYTLPTIVKTISWQDTQSYTPVFYPGYDGYAYFTYSVGNWEGDGLFQYFSLSTDDKEFTLSDINYDWSSEAYYASGQNALISEDYFWILSYGKSGIYRIKRSNHEDVEYFQFPEGYLAGDVGRLCRGGGINLMLYCPAANGQSGYYDEYDAMIYPDGTVIKDGAYFTRNNSIYSGGSVGCTQVAYESGYLWNWGPRNGRSGSTYGCVGMASDRYLGTIANLSSAISKNATQTLKVTYTLTDE